MACDQPDCSPKTFSIEFSVFLLAIIQCAFIVIVVLYMLWGYTDRKHTPILIQFIVAVAWFLSFSVIVFIPLDIYLNEKYKSFDDMAKDREYAMLYDWWASSYWGSYVLNWVVIPLLQGYVVAGEFHVYDKMIRAILVNVPFYILYCLSFIGLLVAIFIIDNQTGNESHILDSQGILAVLQALSLAFGFFCLVCLLGYALVKIPISWWQEADMPRKLERLMFQISLCEDKIIDQQNKVNKLVNFVNEITVEPDIELFKRMMLNEIDTFVVDMQQYDFVLRTGSFLDIDTKTKDKYIKPGQPASYNKLVKLNVDLKYEMTVLKRVYSSKADKIKEAILASDIIEQRSSI